MGLEMLEGSEMGALTESRLGNKLFIDDGEYANFLIPLLGGVAILKGKKTAQKNDAKVAAQIVSQYAVPKEKESDCVWLNAKLVEAQNRYQAVLQKGLKRRLETRETRPLIDVIATLKTFIENAKCGETQAAKDAEALTQRTIQEVNKAATTPLPADVTGDAGTTSNTTKYIMYGVGGLAVIVLFIAIFKKRS